MKMNMYENIEIIAFGHANYINETRIRPFVYGE